MGFDELISVVVPCYNIEKYISACIASIISQTYINTEIILVDDGSTDKTGEMIDKISKTDKRIKVIHQKNAGLSAARNAGLKVAKGGYICFVDGDDFIEDFYLYTLYRKMKDTGADIVSCGYTETSECGNPRKKNSKVKRERQLTGMEAFKDYLTTKNSGYSMAWNKIYRTSLFKDNGIVYPVGRLHEDEYVVYKLYYYSKKVVIIPDSLYFYRMRETSITGKKYDDRRLGDTLNQIGEVGEFITEKGLQKELEPYYDAFVINLKNYLLLLIIKNELNTPGKKEIVKFLLSKKKDSYKNPYISKLVRVMRPFWGLINRRAR